MDNIRQSDTSRTEKNEQKSLYLAADPTSGHMGLKKKKSCSNHGEICLERHDKRR